MSEHVTSFSDEKKQPTIRLRFPLQVKQLDGNTIELPVQEFYGGLFNEEYCKVVEAQIGKRDAASILDDAGEQVMLKVITSQIRRA